MDRLILISLAICSLRSVHSQCHVRLDMVAELSLLNVSGQSEMYNLNSTTAPPLGSGVSSSSAVAKGLTGSMYAMHPLPCPNTTGEWLAAWPGFNLSSSVANFDSALMMFPPLISAHVDLGGFPYNLSNVQLAVNVSQAQLPNGSLSATMAATWHQGWLYTSTPPTGTMFVPLGPGPDGGPMRAISTVLAPSVTVAEGPGPSRLLTVTLPSYFFNFTAVSEPFLVGTTFYKGLSAVFLRGTMTLRAELACSDGTSCGDRGRCIVSNNVTACQCECGWTNDAAGSCTVPSGGCDMFAAKGTGQDVVVLQAAALPPTPSAVPECTSPPPDGSDHRALTYLPSGGSCPTGYSLNLNGAVCNRCPLGFTGPDCGQCQSDAACQSTGNTNMQCINNATYFQYSLGKNYSCALLDDGVKAVLGNNLIFSCSTTPPENSTAAGVLLVPNGAGQVTTATSPVGHTPYCTVNFKLNDFQADGRAVCIGWGCKFGSESSSVSCSLVKCSCPTGCVGLTGYNWATLFDSLEGGIKLECDAPTSAGQPCSLAMSGLPISSISMQCNASECYDPSDRSAKVLGAVIEPGKVRNTDPIIAATPWMALMAATILASTAMLSVLGHIKGGASRPLWPMSGNSHAGCNSSAVAEATEPDTVSFSSSCSHALLSDNPGKGNGLALAEGLELSNRQGLMGADSMAARERDGSSHPSSPLVRHSASCGNNGNHQFAALRFSGTIVVARLNPLRHLLLRTNGNEKYILHGISGMARAGEVVGILGPSGSGKSTLLNVLSGQIQSGGQWLVEGRITLVPAGGQVLSESAPLSGTELCQTVAAVPQHCLFMGGLTVEECLRCSATLRLGPKATASEVIERVESVLVELQIVHLRNRYSAARNSQLSGGEAQRVSIGMELVTNPQVLLLDEPTSGLDSYTALQVLSCLQSMAQSGRIVITSLHQPSPHQFSMLDQVLLIAQGHAAFHGPPGAAIEAFQRLNAPCPPNLFIAEHMLEVFGNPKTASTVVARIQAQRNAQPQSLLDPSPSNDNHQVVVVEAASQWRQAGVLAWRTLATMIRHSGFFMMHVIFAILIGVIVGCVYLHTGNDTAGAQNRVGGIFFAMNLFAFMAVSAVDHPDRQVFERELLRRQYGPVMYMGMLVLADSVLLRVIPATFFTIIFYLLMGLRHTAAAFFTFLFVFTVYNSLLGVLCLLVTALIRTTGQAVLVLNLILLISVLFTGFLVNKASMHWALRWLCYVSPMRYTWEALVINELAPLTLHLAAPGLPPVPDIQGSLFLQLLGVDPSVMTVDIVVLCCLWAGTVLAAMGGMRLRMAMLRGGWAH